MDLFTPLVAPERFHPNFRWVLAATGEDRQVLVDWAAGFVDRDGKFAIEFQTTFNSSFWELYLHAALKDRGCSVDFTKDRPDFCAESPFGPFLMEAVTANNAADQPAEWQGTVADFVALEDRAPIVAEATIRLANALTSKHKKYVDEYAALAWVRRLPFVLAVAPFTGPHARVQNTEAIFKTLYGSSATPYEVLYEDEDGTQLVGGGEFFDTPVARKPNGAEIVLGLFRQHRMREVSAVVFSSVATWGKLRALSKDPNPNVVFETLRSNHHGPDPHHEFTKKPEYVEGLLDGLCVFHNPDALRPLDRRIFRGPKVTQVYWASNWSEPEVEAEDRTLIQRTVVTLTTKGKKS